MGGVKSLDVSILLPEGVKEDEVAVDEAGGPKVVGISVSECDRVEPGRLGVVSIAEGLVCASVDAHVLSVFLSSLSETMLVSLVTRETLRVAHLHYAR